MLKRIGFAYQVTSQGDPVQEQRAVLLRGRRRGPPGRVLEELLDADDSSPSVNQCQEVISALLGCLDAEASDPLLLPPAVLLLDARLLRDSLLLRNPKQTNDLRRSSEQLTAYPGEESEEFAGLSLQPLPLPGGPRVRGVGPDG